ncbi:MAG: carbon-nitrogen hydrolase family protein [Bacillota bacterium]
MFNQQKFTAAVAQISPVFPLNKKASTDKACEFINEAAKKGAKVIVFPECYLPTYPNWSIDLSNPNEWALNLRNLTYNSVEVDGPEISRIGDTARKSGIYVVIGINERQKPYDGVLYNSLVFIGNDGNVHLTHRKVFPSNREKVFHRRGDGTTLKVLETPFGRLGGLICYEHLQPLLKYALISQGEQIHCASWPGWPNFPGGRSNIHIIDIASRQYALEGQNFVLISSLYISPEDGEKAGFGNASWSFFGGSGIINPSGEYIAGPVYDKEDIIYGEIDLGLIPLRKAAVDTTGRDARWNIINLNINAREEQPINYSSKMPKQENISEIVDNLKKITSMLGNILEQTNNS